MNDSQIKTTISKFLGEPTKDLPIKIAIYKYLGKSTKNGRIKIPDYANDLNAMHEAENGLDGFLMLKYTTELLKITGGKGGCFSHIRATARQRSEAFIITMKDFKRGKY